MKTINLEAQRLSQKIGPLVLFNDKENRMLTYKGICDPITGIVLVSLEEMSKEELFELSSFIDRFKRGEA